MNDQEQNVNTKPCDQPKGGGPEKSPGSPIVVFKEDAYALPEGQVVLVWPETIDPQSAAELEEWLALVIRKIKRTSAAAMRRINKSSE